MSNSKGESSYILSWSIFRREFFKDLALLLVLFLLSFLFVYFLPQSFSKLFFLGLLFLFFFSKKNYFWFAYFFILVEGPGYLFADFSGQSQYRLPLYSFLPGFSFTPLDFFVILALLKAILGGKRTELRLRKPLILISLYVIFSFVTTSFIFGTSIEILAWNLRWVFYYTIIISFSYLVTKRDEIYRFMLLIFPSVFFILFTQIYFITTGVEFINLFNPGFRGVALNLLTGELRPLMGGVLLGFFSFIFSLVLLENKDYKQSKWYLYILVVVSFFSIFISATRVWFVMFLFILGGYMLVSNKKVRSSANIVFISFLIVAILVSSGLISRDFLVQSSWGRVSQVFDIARGDVSSVDTASRRFYTQMPIILNIIKQNPFIGYGLSNVTKRYYNNNLGFVNTILMFGFFGFFLFIYFFIKYFVMIQTATKRLTNNNPFRTPLKVMAIAWAGILIGYFSTWDFFAYYFQKTFFVSILIAITELFVREANKEELFSMSQKK